MAIYVFRLTVKRAGGTYFVPLQSWSRTVADDSNAGRCLIVMGRRVTLRLVLMCAVSAAILVAGELRKVATCCELGSEKLSPEQAKALVKKTAPIHAPCCADMLHISGTVVLAISVDMKGNVTCVQVVSGHPLIVGVAIDSVRRWKFAPYMSGLVKKSFCGRVALSFLANEHGVKYQII
jgi:Gram-negative bacterial TonB protein C-terminal